MIVPDEEPIMHISRKPPNMRRALQRFTGGKGIHPRRGRPTSLAISRLAPEVVQRLYRMKNEELAELMDDEELHHPKNHAFARAVVDVLMERLGSYEKLEELGVDLARFGDVVGPEREEWSFVGWVVEGDIVKPREHIFDPGSRAMVDPEWLERYRTKQGCGGEMGRTSDASHQGACDLLRQRLAPLSGETIKATGEIDATRLKQVLHVIMSPTLQAYLEEHHGQRLIMAVHGWRGILLDPSGNHYRLSIEETRRLALVGLLPLFYWIKIARRQPKTPKEEEDLLDKHFKRVPKEEGDIEEFEEKEDYGG